MTRQKGSPNKGYGKSKGGYISLSVNNGRFRAVVSKKIVGEIKYISLGIEESKSTLPDAINLINYIEKQMLIDIEKNVLDRTFNKYIPSKILDKSIVQTVQYYVDNLESKYFDGKRIKNSQSEFNFEVNLLRNLKRFFRGQEEKLLDIELIIQTINSTQPGTNKRLHMVRHLSTMCNLFPSLSNMIRANEICLSDYKTQYEPKIRNLPLDQEIINAHAKIGESKKNFGYTDEFWGWTLGVLATYGLRPHEILAIDFDKSFNPPDYEIHLNQDLCEGVKTGNRVIYPIPPDWVEEFRLYKAKSSDYIKAILSTKSVRWGTKIASTIACRFAYVKIGFRPYDLRHAYAVRGYGYKFEPNQMAKYMGHSIEMHEKTYQKYLSDASKAEDYRNTILNAKHFENLRQGKLSYDDLEKKLHETMVELQTAKNDLVKYQEINKQLELQITQLEWMK